MTRWLGASERFRNTPGNACLRKRLAHETDSVLGLPSVGGL